MKYILLFMILLIIHLIVIIKTQLIYIYISENILDLNIFTFGMELIVIIEWLLISIVRKTEIYLNLITKHKKQSERVNIKPRDFISFFFHYKSLPE